MLSDGFVRYFSLFISCLFNLGFGGQIAAQTPLNALPDAVVVEGNNNIAKAWLIEPTRRYAHGVLGDEIEAAGIQVVLSTGQEFIFRLNDDSVFEDRYPRLADLDGDGADEIVVVHSYLDRGAALAVLEVDEQGLRIAAESRPIGSANRWLNPVGAGDLTGDGKIEIAAILMPHLDGSLVLYRYHGGGLRQLFRGGRYSNHSIGSRNLGLSLVIDVDADSVDELIIPSFDHYSLVMIGFRDGRAYEIDHLLLDSPIAGDITLTGQPGLSIRFELADGSDIEQPIGADGFE